MKINEETTVSEEQILFNKLRYEDQELIIKIMKTLQPCELSCEVEEEKKIPEKINMKWDEDYYVLDENNVKRYLNERDKIEINKINSIIDYLKSKGDE